MTAAKSAFSITDVDNVSHRVVWIPELDRDLVFIRSGLFDPICFFAAEIIAPLVAVITNSRAKTTTENKSEINLASN